MDVDGLINEYKKLYKEYGKNIKDITPRYRKVYFKGVVIGVLAVIGLSFFIATRQSVKLYLFGNVVIGIMLLLAYIGAKKVTKMDVESGYDDMVVSIKKTHQSNLKYKLQERGIITSPEMSVESIQKLILMTTLIEKKIPRFNLPLSFIWPIRDIIVPVVVGLLVSVIVNNGGAYYYYIPALLLIVAMVAFIEFFVKDVIKSTVQKQYDEFIEDVYEIIFSI